MDIAAAGTALTATTLIDTAVLASLPLLALPAVIRGLQIPSDLARAAWLGVIAFFVLSGLGAIFATTDSPLRALGSAIRWILDRARPSRREQHVGFSDRLIERRDQMMWIVERRWRLALTFAAMAWSAPPALA